MSETVIRVENLAKRYRLGLIGRTSLHEDVSRWWARMRGRPDPTLRIDQLQKLELKRRAAAAAPAALPVDAGHMWALRDVSFDVARGEVLGIIGRNGAGKSTLLKILSRVTAPTTGSVKVRGRIASLLEVGTGFHPELTGRENVFLNGAILGMSRREVRGKLEEIIEFSGVGPFVDTPVKRYSSGMYVRLAFSVAAHLNPEILVVDEVLAVGDAAFQKKCLGKMNEVARGGRTVLFVSHNMGSVRSLCSSVLFLAEGETRRRGEPGEVISEYLATSLPAEGTVTFAPQQHRVVSGFQIETLEIVGTGGTQGPAMSLGEDVVLRLGFRASEALAAVELGIELYGDGVCVTSLHSPPLRVERGTERHYATCRIPGSCLCPGQYEVHVGAALHERSIGLDWIPMASSFSVSNVAANPGDELGRRQRGLVRLPASWSLPPDGRREARDGAASERPQGEAALEA